MFSAILFTTLISFAVVAFYMMKRRYTYWTLRGVPGAAAKFPWGNEKGCIFHTHAIDLMDWMYEKGRGHAYWGYIDLLTPTLLIRDTELIEKVLVKDFDYFTDRRGMPLSKEFKHMLIAMKGDEWRAMRRIITPTFTSAKMRRMHNLCEDNAKNLVQYIRNQLEQSEEQELNMKDIFGRFTLDNIALCAFGVRINSFHDSKNTFAKYAAQLFRLPSGYGRLRLLLLLILPTWLVHELPDPNYSTMKFFRSVIENTIKQRERNPSTGYSDYLSLLMETCDSKGHRLLNNEAILHQAVMFLIAGYDTTANLLVYASYCLAQNPLCQQLAREEVTSVMKQNDGKLTYEATAELKYISQVLQETLRLYPAVAKLERVCTRPYTIPDGSGLVLDKGTLIAIPVLATHRDPDIYPDPMMFKPERFNTNSFSSTHTPFLAFGSGPRQCIAKRFALFEAKVALANVLLNFELRRCASTVADPVELSRKSILLVPKNDTLFLSVGIFPRSNTD